MYYGVKSLSVKVKVMRHEQQCRRGLLPSRECWLLLHVVVVVMVLALELAQRGVWRKAEVRPEVGVSVLCSWQCFDTVEWGEGHQVRRNPVPLIATILFQVRWRKKTDNQLTQVHLDKRRCCWWWTSESRCYWSKWQSKTQVLLHVHVMLQF